MARTLPVFVLFAALGACGQGSGTPATSDRPEAMGDLPRVSVGNSIQVPTDLVAEAVYLRSIGGVVVRASLRDRSATSTQISSSPPYFLAMDFVNGTFEVTDAVPPRPPLVVPSRADVVDCPKASAVPVPVPANV